MKEALFAAGSRKTAEGEAVPDRLRPERRAGRGTKTPHLTQEDFPGETTFKGSQPTLGSS